MNYKIEHEDGIVFAINDELSIYGFGDTEEEAIKDLEQHFSYFKDYYASANNLIGTALRLKELYARVV